MSAITSVRMPNNHASLRIQSGPKNSKPLQNDQKIVLNRIKACQWD